MFGLDNNDSKQNDTHDGQVDNPALPPSDHPLATNLQDDALKLPATEPASAPTTDDDTAKSDTTLTAADDDMPKDNDITATPVVANEPDQPDDTNDDDAGDLIDIKQQALQQLSPLIGHLDQTPEEKFRTTMMMIQASDNQSLVKPAYEAAQQIKDEKAKAQALLDIINEINYFTQQHNS